MIMRVPFGDWSDDGHKQKRDIWVSVPTWDSISNAQARIKEQYGDDTEITVDAIGGLECAKCHY